MNIKVFVITLLSIFIKLRISVVAEYHVYLVFTQFEMLKTVINYKNATTEMRLEF